VSFSQIYAQDQVIAQLRRAIVEDQVGHAFLFYGPEGIGKRTTALAFAMALNCEDAAARAGGDSCGQCRSCRLIAVGNHPDIRVFTPETTGGKTVIPIDAIRTKVGEHPAHPLPLREDAALKPMEGRCKVYIIDPANRPGLQEDAGNALLLTLEEPPPHVVIILVSSRPTAMLPTLVSRCRPLRFTLAPRPEVVRALEVLETLAPEQVTAIAGLASGRIGWALAAATHPRILEVRQALLQEVDRLLPSGRKAALRLAECLHTLAASNGDAAVEGEETKTKNSADRIARRQLPELLDILASWWRDLLLTVLGQPASRMNVDFLPQLDRQGARLSAIQLQDGLHTIMRAKRLIERNANIDLTLEWMWMQLLP
jgi:DNA polymerase-3 subunit delta'